MRLGKHVHSKQRKTLPHNFCTFTSSLCEYPASSALIECIFSTYILVWYNIRNSLVAEKTGKFVKIHRFYKVEDDIQ